MNMLLADAIREAWGLHEGDMVRTAALPGAWAFGVRVRRGWRVVMVVIPRAVILAGQLMEYLKPLAPVWAKEHRR